MQPVSGAGRRVASVARAWTNTRGYAESARVAGISPIQSVAFKPSSAEIAEAISCTRITLWRAAEATPISLL